MDSELPKLSPDAERALHFPLGMASPLWWTFGTAAAAGAAWWWMTRWTQVSSLPAALEPTNLEAVSDANLGLQLSGHTHGGQMFPGTIIGDVVWGSRNAGLSKHGNTWQFTSRGCGFVGPPMRVGAAPEIVKIVLLPA